MQSSKTVSSDEQEVDVESFIETENSVNLGESNGTARLKSCDVSNNPPEGLPQDYKDEYTSFSYDEYFVFDAKTVEDCSKDIQVVLPAEEGHEEIDIAYGWTDASSVSDLAGSVVPIRHISGDTYRVEDFDGLLSGFLSAEKTEELADRGIFEYRRGNWHIDSQILAYSRIVSSVLLTAIFAYAMLQNGWFSILVGICILWTLSLIYRHKKNR